MPFPDHGDWQQTVPRTPRVTLGWGDWNLAPRPRRKGGRSGGSPTPMPFPPQTLRVLSATYLGGRPGTREAGNLGRDSHVRATRQGRGLRGLAQDGGAAPSFQAPSGGGRKSRGGSDCQGARSSPKTWTVDNDALFKGRGTWGEPSFEMGVHREAGAAGRPEGAPNGLESWSGTVLGRQTGKMG